MFLNKLVDWKDFEHFVRDLYKDDGDVIVEHNVTLKGKSGADRQIDVLITRKSKLHSYKTLVECKYWKNKVERNIVDIVYAGMDDLNIEKGVIFTTTGYEAGAVKYAKSKNIDIFVVRDLTPEEWGLPGQIIQFYLHIVAGEIKNMRFPNAIGIPLVKEYPKNLKLDIHLSKDMDFSDEYQLYSIKNGNKGDNLIKLIISLHSKLLSILTKDTFVIEGGKDCALHITAPVILDFSESEYCQLRNQYGAINITKIILDVDLSLLQSEISIDRAEKYNIALAIENYINNQVNLVFQEQGENGLVLTDNIYEKIIKTASSNEEILTKGSIIKVTCDYWVSSKIPEKSFVIEKHIDTPILLKINEK